MMGVTSVPVTAARRQPSAASPSARIAKRPTSRDFAGEGHFVTCFSEVEDDLSQWRGYGGGECGYALGFDAFPHALSQIIQGLKLLAQLFGEIVIQLRHGLLFDAIYLGRVLKNLTGQAGVEMVGRIGDLKPAFFPSLGAAQMLGKFRQGIGCANFHHDLIHLYRLPWGFGLLVWLTLLPSTILANVLRLMGVSAAVRDRWDVVAVAITALAALAFAHHLAVGWKAKVSSAVATCGLLAASAGPIPVINSPRARALFLGVSALWSGAGALLPFCVRFVRRFASVGRRSGVEVPPSVPPVP